MGLLHIGGRQSHISTKKKKKKKAKRRPEQEVEGSDFNEENDPEQHDAALSQFLLSKGRIDELLNNETTVSVSSPPPGQSNPFGDESPNQIENFASWPQETLGFDNGKGG